ncbi:helix-turn-helix domain-containing protein [Streptomyces sp. NBC_00846]|uniref:helix-turn-helix domain-containing protein n=1 Tax=Streptomyces sp. NBC_00846 TaxID=2975849 RepID=UPI00386A204C|nr:helix-turn-helix domain-containing protein [Streptomyces sp. NBC_00846]
MSYPQVPDHAWRDQRVRRALQTWDFGAISKLIREATSLKQRHIALLTGLSQPYVSQLERGTYSLSAREAIVDFLSGLSMPDDLAVDLIAPLIGQNRSECVPYVDLDPMLPWTADRMVAALDVAAGGGAVNRRGFLALSGAELMGHVFQWSTTEPEPEEDVELPEPGARIGTALLSAVQSTTDALRMTDAKDGSGGLAQTAKAHLDFMRGIGRSSSYSDATGRNLAAVIADTSIQAGWFHFDAGAHDQAQAYFLAALRAARTAQDVRLGAGALSYIAIHGYSTGSPREAVGAAQAARQKLRGLNAPALEAMLCTRQARGHAKIGEDRQARNVLDRAEELCALGAGEDDPHWLYWINPGEIHGQRGSCLLDLGDFQGATRSFAGARCAMNPDETRTCAQFLAREATAHMRTGDPEAGCAAGHRALDMAERVDSARLTDHISTMLDEVRPMANTPYARDLLERGRTVRGVPSP